MFTANMIADVRYHAESNRYFDFHFFCSLVAWLPCNQSIYHAVFKFYIENADGSYYFFYFNKFGFTLE